MTSRAVMISRFSILLLASTSLLAACQEQHQAVPAPARPVLVQTVAFEPHVAERTFVATIRPRIESDLGFRVGGKIAQRQVNVGDVVSAGQVLATLDEADLRLQVEQAEAERAAASAALTQAEAELRRVGELRAQGWSTTATQERQTAIAEEARGRLARGERALSLARNALSYATLTADAAGVVTAISAEPGQVVAAGQVVVRVAQSAEKEAVVAVPEAQMRDIREAMASVTLWSDPNATFKASLRELSASADPATRTYLARFSIPEADARVQLGMTATLHLTEQAGANVARLPLSALFAQGEGPGVWVIGADGRPTLKPVQVEAYESRDVLIRSGLKDGEQVVTLGVQKLDPTQRVRVVQALQF